MEEETTLVRLREAFRRSGNTSTSSGLDPEEFLRDLHQRLVVDGEELQPETYPVLGNLSAAFIYRFMFVPTDRKPAEFVYVPSTVRYGINDSEETRASLLVTQWNMCWEAGRLRPHMFEDEMPRRFDCLRRHEDRNVFLLPRGKRHQYYAHAPLFHMLPKELLKRHGLPPLRRGLWPHYLEDYWLEAMLPDDFDARLSNAYADFIWGHIDSGSGYGAFADHEPLRLLAHNLDFWLPHAHDVAEERLRQMPRVEVENEEQGRLLEQGRSEMPAEVELQRPRMGTILWEGEAEADRAVQDMVDRADQDGHLRSIIDAVRSNRVEEDFSERWSFAREDFERKLYRKRSKIGVKFVELDDTIPVHGPESEVHEDLLWEDFLAVLDPKERQITVLLRSGHTKLVEIAEHMGYANHSPISKALARIRKKAIEFLN